MSGAGTIIFLLVYLIDPAISGLFPPCPFHSLTNLYCPGCGSLRSLHQLSHGNLAAAFGLNPLMVLFLPVSAYLFVSGIPHEIAGKEIRNALLPARIIWLILASIIIFWILRNIPHYPFTLLAP